MNKENFYQVIAREKLSETVKNAKLPAFLYFRQVIQRKFQDLIGCLPPVFEPHYAFKANPNREVVQFIRALGMGADVASIGELGLARETGYPAEKIEFTGPGKSEDEISWAVDMGISCINVESISEIKMISHLCRAKGKKARIGIRVNPRKKPAGSGLTMAGDSQFGMIEDDLEEAFRIIRSQNQSLEFVGLHMHLGSQFLEADRLLSNFRLILEKSNEIVERYDVRLQKINFGGGWGIDPFGKKPPLNLEMVRDGLAQLLTEPPYTKMGTEMKLTVEPGRFIVAECGVYAARILYRKHGYQKEFLILDGGMHHHYGAAGGIGQVIRRNYEIACLSNHNEGGQKARFTIVGSLCLPDDILASDVELPCRIAEGDLILFFNSGAYGLTASPVKFLSHPPPQELFIG
jgi:diaminopimelate decarboxylase